MRQKRNAHNFWLETLKKTRSLGRSRHRWEDNIIMDLTNKYDGRVCTASMWLRIGARSMGPCEHNNEPSGSMKGGEFDYLSNY
jgi:hypothetical protein